MAVLLEGKPVAEAIYSKVLLNISLLPALPKIAFVLVGEDAASQTYVRMKAKKCLDLGISGETIELPSSVAESVLIEKIHELNRSKSVHGILVQLPLPKGLNRNAVLGAIDPKKDVDGLHPENAGRLFQGDPRFIPCTPLGILEILKAHSIPIEGKRAVVIGRSDIVGKPMAQLLLMNHATVTICHSKTLHLAEEVRRADIVVAALGRPLLVKGDMVKEGAVVIDVGINRVEGKIVGDVDFESVVKKAGYITPVPGGVGPMTIACLMKNLTLAAALQQGAKI